METETINAIITVLISSIIAAVPSWFLINANKRKIEADASTTAADVTDKLNETAIEWIEKMENKVEEADALVNEYRIEADEMRTTLSEILAKLKAVETENKALRARLRIQTDKLEAAGETIRLQDAKIASMQKEINHIQEANLEYMMAVKILSDQLTDAKITPRYKLPRG